MPEPFTLTLYPPPIERNVTIIVSKKCIPGRGILTSQSWCKEKRAFTPPAQAKEEKMIPPYVFVHVPLG